MESLSQEQLEVLQIVTKQRKNIFFTGSAGTGKSFLLRQIIKEFRKNLKYNEVAVTGKTNKEVEEIERREGMK